MNIWNQFCHILNVYNSSEHQNSLVDVIVEKDSFKNFLTKFYPDPTGVFKWLTRKETSRNFMIKFKSLVVWT